ncbi:peptidase S15, partial [Penicillium samsonianum]|uniref:peptidase S15 n=1 Tax=Penicillium samsonianum TaxID=1882272 RepID=UPI002547D10A
VLLVHISLRVVSPACGITCLLYDPRSLGASDGNARNDVKNPLVDDTKLALWGLCFGGNVTLAVAAFEYRVAATIAFAPLDRLNWYPGTTQANPQAGYTRAHQPPGKRRFYISPLRERGQQYSNSLQIAAEMIPALERLGVPVDNRISVQAYYRSLSWNILNLVQYIFPTAIMVTPELDVSCLTEDQLKCYKQI